MEELLCISSMYGKNNKERKQHLTHACK